MIDEVVREKALALAEAVRNLEEYREFLEMEKNLKADSEAQAMIMEFQKKQQDFVTKQMSGIFDNELLSELTDLQSKLNARDSVVMFIESYNRLLSVIGEILDLISERLELDVGEVYRR
ncbi:MAG: YlbF family regulator [Archaeoglobaceae archaeon]|uniref:YlbF family regulator n=1 Tax=Archaeoglobus fulgidus TaxID=2234 RepID=A0A7J3M500_ARCFL